jgi:hypothetical protein
VPILGWGEKEGGLGGHPPAPPAIEAGKKLSAA